MKRIKKLEKFSDARGWSLNDIYAEFRKYSMSSNKLDRYASSGADAGNCPDFQVNYSILHPGVIKAWHRHKYQDDYFCVLHGNAQVGIFSEELSEDGKLRGPEKHFIGETNPAIIHIKAGEWHGLTAVGNEPVGLLYLVTRKYDPQNPDEERAACENFAPEGWWLPENK
tara:strand:+ start:4495 stop:5001 length:507 start_codon:yes stop_codon:yes gene_type:complete